MLTDQNHFGRTQLDHLRNISDKFGKIRLVVSSEISDNEEKFKDGLSIVLADGRTDGTIDDGRTGGRRTIGIL